MVDKKADKETKKKKDSEKEEAPRLVEIYGDDVREEERVEVKKKEDKKKEEENKKEDGDDLKESGKIGEDVDMEEMMRQTFKTEVVNQEVNKKEDEKKKVSKDKKKEMIINKSSQIKQDDIAFDDEIGSQKKAVRGVFGVGAIVFLVIFGLTGWAFYLKSVWLPNESVSKVMVEASPTPDLSPTPVPTPTPLERKEIVLEILNGSGVTGLAGTTKKTFEGLGYTVDSVGNAEDTSSNELYIQEESLNKLSALYEDVLEELEISSPSGYLDKDEDVVARIVLGK